MFKAYRYTVKNGKDSCTELKCIEGYWNSVEIPSYTVISRCSLEQLFRRFCPVKQVLTGSSGPARLRCRWMRAEQTAMQASTVGSSRMFSRHTPDPRTRRCYTTHTSYVFSGQLWLWGGAGETASRCGSSWWEWPSGIRVPLVFVHGWTKR